MQFNLSNEFGIVSVLSGQMEMADALQDSGVPNLTILACGPLPPNPAEVLNAANFQEFLESSEKSMTSCWWTRRLCWL